MERLISAHTVEHGSVVTSANENQPSGVREEHSGKSGVTWKLKSPRDTENWASTRLRRVRPSEKGTRSKVLPRAVPQAPHTASPSVARKPLGIAAAWQRAKRSSNKVISRLASSMREVIPRHIESRRQRLKMMCVMAARQGRNVEC